MTTEATTDLMALARAIDDPRYADEAALLTPEERYAIKQLGDPAATRLTVLGKLAASGRLPPKQVERLFQQTRLMGRAAGRAVLEMLFEKAALGDASPYDAKVLMFLARGFGVVSDSKPVTDDEREKAVAAAANARSMSDTDLAAAILEVTTATHDTRREESKNA